MQEHDSERTDSFDIGELMPLLKFLVWSKWPKMISPAEDDNYLGVRLLLANLERSKKRANPGEGVMNIMKEQVEVGILKYQIKVVLCSGWERLYDNSMSKS